MTLPEHPVRARQRKIGLILGALTSLSVALVALLTSPPKV